MRAVCVRGIAFAVMFLLVACGGGDTQQPREPDAGPPTLMLCVGLNSGACTTLAHGDGPLDVRRFDDPEMPLALLLWVYHQAIWQAPDGSTATIQLYPGEATDPLRTLTAPLQELPNSFWRADFQVEYCPLLEAGGNTITARSVVTGPDGSTIGTHQASFTILCSGIPEGHCPAACPPQ
jgi:hypothetical protein